MLSCEDSASRERLPAVTLLGPELPCGAYLLRIRLAADLQLAFGRFRAGQPLDLPAGEYAYLGSAMAERGSASLAMRLLRHTARGRGRSPHTIRADLWRALADGKAGRHPPPPAARKRLHWHVDYLLDRPEATLSHAIVVRSGRRLEGALGAILGADPHVRALAPGLGASDAPGASHLVQVQAGEGWWVDLPGRILEFTQERESSQQT